MKFNRKLIFIGILLYIIASTGLMFYVPKLDNNISAMDHNLLQASLARMQAETASHGCGILKEVDAAQGTIDAACQKTLEHLKR